MRERTELVSESPEAGKQTNHLDTREAAMGNFSIYYKTSKDTISIMAFWDNRQNPKKLYKILIK